MSYRVAKHQDAQEELKRVNAYLDAIVENIPDMIFVKDAETLLFERFNRAGEEMLGWKREELLGKTDHDFYPKEQADFFHAKDRETLRNGALVDIPEEPIETKHGLRYLHTRKVPIFDEQGRPRYLLGISEDITARKLVEERVHALERELAAVVRHARDAILTWSLDGCIVSWNEAAEALYGIPSGRAIGAPIETLVPDEERASFQAAQQQLVSGKRLSISTVYRLCRGREVEVEESLFLIRDQAGQSVRIGSIARDTTELSRLRRATEILSGTQRSLDQDGLAPTESATMREVLVAAEIVAQQGAATVLLLGETGVGKGWLARRIHAQSPRAPKPFFEVNCANLEAQLAESELFGHERGAFTGAATQKRGLAEAAEGGTLFLDEIGELSLGVQAKLLTFLDSRQFRRIGGVRNLAVDVRILAASNVDLKQAAERGTFRKDLYYRLSVIPLRVPSLRERRPDILPLAQRLLRELLGDVAAPHRSLSTSVVTALARYDWPGNVRELRNALERALILSRGGPIEVAHLPLELRQLGAPAIASDPRLLDVEQAHIRSVLEQARGNRTRAAELLGISRSTIKRKLKKLQIEEPHDSSTRDKLPSFGYTQRHG